MLAACMSAACQVPGELPVDVLAWHCCRLFDPAPLNVGLVNCWWARCHPAASPPSAECHLLAPA